MWLAVELGVLQHGSYDSAISEYTTSSLRIVVSASCTCIVGYGKALNDAELNQNVITTKQNGVFVG